jgi:hypothetical protein
MKMWRMRKGNEEKQQPENRIFQRKSIHKIKPFIAQ